MTRGTAVDRVGGGLAGRFFTYTDRGNDQDSVDDIFLGFVLHEVDPEYRKEIFIWLMLPPKIGLTSDSYRLFRVWITTYCMNDDRSVHPHIAEKNFWVVLLCQIFG